MVAEIAASLKSQGRTLLDRLDDIARTYGLHATDQLAVRVDDLDPDPRGDGAPADAHPDGSAVSPSRRSRTSSAGVGRPPADRRHPTPPRRPGEGGGDPPAPSRSSSAYFEVVIAVHGGDVDAARIGAAGRLDAIRHDLARAAGLPAA